MATFQSIAPIFPTADMDAMQAHYEALGFDVHVLGGGYGTASRDGVRLHFRLDPDLDPASERGAAYIAVDDADALHAEWTGGGRRRDVRPVRSGLRRVGGRAHRRRRQPAAVRLARLRALTLAPSDGRIAPIMVKTTTTDLLLT